MEYLSNLLFAGGPTMQGVIVGLILVISGVFYFWAAKRHFLRPESGASSRDLRKMKLIVQLAGAFYWLHLILILRNPDVSSVRFAASIAIGIAALALFASAIHATRANGLFLAFATRGPERIVDTGAYRITRHPFYVAYTLTFLMGCCFTLHVAAFLSTAVMMVFYRLAALDEEKRLLSSKLAPEYKAYSARMRLFGLWRERSSHGTQNLDHAEDLDRAVSADRLKRE